MKRATPLLLVFLLAGCNSGYDARRDCEETVACGKAMSAKSAASLPVDQCATASEDEYQKLTDEQKESLALAASNCDDRGSCDYILCVCKELNIPQDKCLPAKLTSDPK